jgi:hypothetical protein
MRPRWSNCSTPSHARSEIAKAVVGRRDITVQLLIVRHIRSNMSLDRLLLHKWRRLGLIS